MPARFRYGPRFNAGTLQDVADPRLALDRGERAAFRRLHARREQLREENPEEYRRAVLKSAAARSTTMRRKAPVSLPVLRCLEGC